MNEIIDIIRNSRKNTRVRLDNGESDLIPSYLADIGLSYKKYKKNFYVINVESKLFMKLNDTPKLSSPRKIIEAEDKFKANYCDHLIKENNKDMLVEKMLIAKKEGFVLKKLITTYYPTKEEPPRTFYYAMYNKPDSSDWETSGA